MGDVLQQQARVDFTILFLSTTPSFAAENTGESLTEHIFTLVLRALSLVMRRNNDPEFREGLSAA